MKEAWKESKGSTKIGIVCSGIICATLLIVAIVVLVQVLVSKEVESKPEIIFIFSWSLKTPVHSRCNRGANSNPKDKRNKSHQPGSRPF